MKGRGGEGGMRGLRRLLSLLAVLGTVLLGATAEARPLPAPGAFELQASNGYSIFVLSIPSSRRGPSAVLLIVRGKAADVSYFAPATVTGSSIQASLGDLGEIDVRFQPSGRARREHPVCSREDAVFDAGFYAGTIQFNGEEGYTQVTATRAPGDLQAVLDILCPGAGGASGSGLPGAELSVEQRVSRLGPSFKANKNHSSARALFGASIAERSGRIAITRTVEAWAAPSAFDYDPLLRTATVTPPPPFSGEAVFHRNATRPNRWTGTLSVDFPGRSDVSLTDGNLRTSLIHARWEGLRRSHRD